MRSESQTRWEKGVAPELAEPAANHATRAARPARRRALDRPRRRQGGLPGAARDPAAPRARRGGRRHPDRRDDQRERLTRLGFDVDGEWNVRTPYWRARDVRREIDLVEEVARFHLEEVPPTLPARREMFGRLDARAASPAPGRGRPRRLRLLRGVHVLAAGRRPAPGRARAAGAALRAAARPADDAAATGSIGAARHNVNVGTEDVALFEIAHVYLPTGEPLPDEPWRLGGIVRGGFYRAKGAVEQVFSALKLEPRFERAAHPFMPSPASASVRRRLGRAARPAPARRRVVRVRARPRRAVRARARSACSTEDVITYPPVRQDLAFSVPEEVAAGDLVAAAREAAGEELREMRAFDVYRGEQVGDGPEVGRLRGRVPVARADAVGRGRSEAPRARSSTRSGSGSAPSSAPENRFGKSPVQCPRCRVTGSYCFFSLPSSPLSAARLLPTTRCCRRASARTTASPSRSPTRPAPRSRTSIPATTRST